MGGTGFIGAILVRAFVAHGHRVTLLVRPGEGHPGEGVRIIGGDPAKPGEWQRQAGDHDIIVNLAGATIFRRWTRAVRQEILESRIQVTRRVVEAVASRKREKIRLFNASGVGYYGFHTDEIVSEGMAGGKNFLAQVAASWEEEAEKVRGHGADVLLCRFGIVLGRTGGALPQLLLLAKRRAAVRFGHGGQWFSWIHEQDLARAFLYLLQFESVEGPVNFTSPHPVRNRELMGLLAETSGKKPLLPMVPAFLFKLLYGEFATLFLEGQRVMPKILLESGFTFLFPGLREALSDLLR